MATSTRLTTRNTARRYGLTLVEMLVVIGIVGILIALVSFGAGAVQRSQDRIVAEQQIALIANAIEKYADFWPAWEVTGANGTRIKLADRAWPDYLPARLFNPLSGDYQQQPQFNMASDLQFFAGVLNGPVGNLSGIVEQPGLADDVQLGDVLNANICLTYALTAEVGEGPYLDVDDQGALIKSASEVADLNGFDALPQRLGANVIFHNNELGSKRKLVLVDPWGTPYRYFWVARDLNNYSGYSAVRNGNPGNSNFRRAVGFVLESAGPDRRFGNVWEPVFLIETDPRVTEAADNITVRRP